MRADRLAWLLALGTASPALAIGALIAAGAALGFVGGGLAGVARAR